MSKNQVPEFDENFFANIDVPLKKDYSRLSSSPSRDQPCDTSYFDKHFNNLECDTPVKMRLPTVDRDSGDALPPLCMDNFLSSSSASDNTVNGDQRDSGEAAVTTAIEAPVEAAPKQQLREPLKIVPTDTTVAPISTSGYDEMVDGIQKLNMFAPKEPEERLSQRRRSAQRKKQEEESKRRSQISASSKTVASANRARSISTKRSISREPTAAARAPSVPRSRHNSVTRTISAPVAVPEGVVTRSMAARAAEGTTSSFASKPIVRRSVMPLKIAQKTPVSAIKDAATSSGGDRSRDRTRRTNTTSSASRRSVFPGKASGASTPIAPPRRSASANKESAVKTTPAARPMATANRSSMLRMNAVKPTVPIPPAPTVAAPTSGQKPTAAAANAVRNRVPLRVAPLTPSAVKKPTAVVSGAPSGHRPLARQPPVLRSQSVERGSAQKQPPPSLGTPRQPATKGSRAELFKRLSMPKSAVTPQRVSNDGPTSSLRKSAVRPVPSYVHSLTKNGLFLLLLNRHLVLLIVIVRLDSHVLDDLLVVVHQLLHFLLVSLLFASSTFIEHLNLMLESDTLDFFELLDLTDGLLESQVLVDQAGQVVLGGSQLALERMDVTASLIRSRCVLLSLTLDHLEIHMALSEFLTKSQELLVHLVHGNTVGLVDFGDVSSQTSVNLTDSLLVLLLGLFLVGDVITESNTQLLVQVVDLLVKRIPMLLNFIDLVLNHNLVESIFLGPLACGDEVKFLHKTNILISHPSCFHLEVGSLASGLLESNLQLLAEVSMSFADFINLRVQSLHLHGPFDLGLVVVVGGDLLIVIHACDSCFVCKSLAIPLGTESLQLLSSLLSALVELVESCLELSCLLVQPVMSLDELGVSSILHLENLNNLLFVLLTLASDAFKLRIEHAHLGLGLIQLGLEAALLEQSLLEIADLLLILETNVAQLLNFLLEKSLLGVDLLDVFTELFRVLSPHPAELLHHVMEFLVLLLQGLHLLLLFSRRLLGGR